MRMSMDRIIELYKSSPLFQDLLETAAGTGLAAGGQALFTDMSPEEIALASGAAFGAGMVGRPIVGRAGQALGGVVDRRYPQVGKTIMSDIEAFTENAPPGVREVFEAKMNPYKHLGGTSQYLNMVGRGYGDNIAQAVVALTAPGILSGDKEVE